MDGLAWLWSRMDGKRAQLRPRRPVLACGRGNARDESYAVIVGLAQALTGFEDY